jgi:hypothetical protein
MNFEILVNLPNKYDSKENLEVFINLIMKLVDNISFYFTVKQILSVSFISNEKEEWLFDKSNAFLS